MGWLDDRAPYVDAHHNDFAEVLAEQAVGAQSAWEQLGQPIAASEFYDRLRWDAALQQRILLRMRRTAVDFGTAVARELGGDLDDAALDDFLDSTSRLSAEHMNEATERRLQEAVVSEDPETAVAGVFAELLDWRTAALAAATFTLAASFGRHTAADQNGARKKTWYVNSGNPRSSHAALNGETVNLDEEFSNGMRWPGDASVGDASEIANCQCSVVFDA